MIRKLTWTLLVLSLFSLVACANLQTINRSTTLPKTDGDGGVAIHLDAQQRLVLVNALGKYCAEPSPDALAAYAASLGLGASIPSQGSASLAQALQSSAGSIGLRTQSITLMRDSLYRICEAYSNNAIGPVQVATLLGRSQDLTAVILAIEQLTGAVAASQVILTGTAGAGASASALSNNQLLAAAREDEVAKQKSLDEATKERDAAKEKADNKQKEINEIAARKTYADTSDPDHGNCTAELEKKKGELSPLQSQFDAAERQVNTKKELLDKARETRETIEKVRDSALTNAVANTTSAGQFSIPVQRKELSKESTETIATAVQGMVERVLSKEYTRDACLAFILNNPEDYEEILKNDKRKEAYGKVL
ncbi:MAG: hypothetical protein HGA78_03985 [Nitrospirales bacterium]|nr:hypothetical protein [Nitrospirales bacterium]